MDTIGFSSRAPHPPSSPDRGRSATDSSPAAAPPTQQILRLIEEQGQIGFWWQDADRDDIEISAGFARITGLAPTQRHTRDSLLQAIHPNDLRFQDDQARLVDLGQPLRREFRIIRPDGTLRWVSCRIDVVVGNDGQPVRSIGILVDVTERRAASRAAEYNQERRLALMEAVAVKTWLVDAGSDAVDLAAFARMTGQTLEECRNEGWARAIHPDDRDRVLARHRAAIRDGALYEATYRVRTADGVYKTVLSRAAPVRDRSGAVIEWQGVTLPAENVTAADGEGTEAQANVALSGVQIRGARGLLDWSLAQLAAASGVSVSTIKRMEDGTEGRARPSKTGAVRRALEQGGVSFRTVDGVTWISL